MFLLEKAIVEAGKRKISDEELGPLSDFELTGRSYDVAGTKRIKELAAQIEASGEINPLIVVIDAEGPYILEGGHRSEALFRLGAKSFPALVVIDESED